MRIITWWWGFLAILFRFLSLYTVPGAIPPAISTTRKVASHILFLCVNVTIMDIYVVSGKLHLQWEGWIHVSLYTLMVWVAGWLLGSWLCRSESLGFPFKCHCDQILIIFIHNRSFLDILPNFDLFRPLQCAFFGPLFPRIWCGH